MRDLRERERAEEGKHESGLEGETKAGRFLSLGHKSRCLSVGDRTKTGIRNPVQGVRQECKESVNHEQPTAHGFSQPCTCCGRCSAAAACIDATVTKQAATKKKAKKKYKKIQKKIKGETGTKPKGGETATKCTQDGAGAYRRDSRFDDQHREQKVARQYQEAAPRGHHRNLSK